MTAQPYGHALITGAVGGLGTAMVRRLLADRSAGLGSLMRSLQRSRFSAQMTLHTLLVRLFM